VSFYPLSGFIRFCILTLPFKVISRWLGKHFSNNQLSVLVSESQMQRAREIGSLIAIFEKYTPWKTNCLVQAILCRILLGYYHIPYIIYLGTFMTKDQNEPMKAHAWVSVGSKVIAGRGYQKFVIVSSFTSCNYFQKMGPTN
jgi:hypothetical protein